MGSVENPKLASTSEPKALEVSDIATTKAQKRSCTGMSGSVLAQIWAEIKGVFFDTWLSILLVLVPFGFMSNYLGWGDGWTFGLSALALVALSERLGFITEQLAMYTNDSIGGLLNATFGNATELIISAFALSHGYLRIVQLTLLGSVISNLLLVMGSAFIAGGFRHKVQEFNQQGVNVNCGLLILGVVAVVLPSLLGTTDTGGDVTVEAAQDALSAELALSRFESIFLLAAYLLYLVFQLYTHRHLYEEAENSEEAASHKEIESKPVSKGGHCEETDSVLAFPHQSSARTSFRMTEPSALALVAEEEEEEKVLSFIGCFIWLAVATVFIAFLSEFIMDAITGASLEYKIPLPFLTTIILPIVGNAAEHASAIVFAYKNRIEISLGVCIGSSTQVAVLGVPFCVVLAWVMGQPLTLNFVSFETTCYFFSVLLAIIIVQDGKANWLKGVLLVLTYIFVSAGFWCHKDKLLDTEQSVGVARRFFN